MDIRLKELPFDFDGRKYLLRCNMNVLADVQEAFGGSISAALSAKSPTKGVLSFLAAMLNDYADEHDWPDRYTSRQVGRKLPASCLNSVCKDVMKLVAASLRGDDLPEPEGEVKN